jgi:hypothetical protein
MAWSFTLLGRIWEWPAKIAGFSRAFKRPQVCVLVPDPAVDENRGAPPAVTSARPSGYGTCGNDARMGRALRLR